MIFSPVFKIRQDSRIVKRIYKKSQEDKKIYFCENLFLIFPAIFTGSHPVSFLESTHEMFRAFISDKFTDRRVAQGSFPQCTARLIQLDIPDDLKKSFSGTFFDQGTEMGNTVTKMTGCLAQRNCLVMLVQIVQNLCDRISGSILCKYGFDIDDVT